MNKRLKHRVNVRGCSGHGGTGYIGSHVVLNMADAGKKVVVLEDVVTGFDTAIDGRAHFESGEAGDIDLVRGSIDKLGITDIEHFAGSIVVPESFIDPLKMPSTKL